MAVDIRALPAFFNTDADFRAWGSGLNAQFTAMGLVKTTDTGQIDWTTVVKPAAINTFQGYEIWRFADSLQATKPVFFKVEYGSGAAVDRPNLAYTVGTGSNGSGTINGQTNTRTIILPTASKTAGATLNSYCSGSTSRLSLVTNFDPTTNTFHMTLLIERPRNSAGVEQGDCIVTFSLRNGYQLIPYLTAVPALSSTSPTVDTLGGVSIIGTDVALCPALICVGRLLIGTWLVYSAADIGALGSFTCTHLGASRTFMPFGNVGMSPNNMTQRGTATMAFAILWE